MGDSVKIVFVLIVKILKKINGHSKVKMKLKNQIWIEELSGFRCMDSQGFGLFYLYGNASDLISLGLFFV